MHSHYTFSVYIWILKWQIVVYATNKFEPTERPIFSSETV